MFMTRGSATHNAYIPTLSLSTLKFGSPEKKNYYFNHSVIPYNNKIIIICGPYSSASRTFFWFPLPYANNNNIIMILHGIIITAHGGNKSVFTILSACVQVCEHIAIYSIHIE